MTREANARRRRSGRVRDAEGDGRDGFESWWHCARVLVLVLGMASRLSWEVDAMSHDEAGAGEGDVARPC